MTAAAPVDPRVGSLAHWHGRDAILPPDKAYGSPVFDEASANADETDGEIGRTP